MSEHQNRHPKGVPTGGQYAATEKADAATELDAYIYDDAEDCIAAGSHLSDVDDDGYCGYCGHDTGIEVVPADVQAGDVLRLDSGDEVLVEAVTRDEDGATRIGFTHGEDAVFDHETYFAERIGVDRLLAGHARIENPELRADCEAYAARYAPAPAGDYEPNWDWNQQRQRAARDVQIGDRLHPYGEVVTGVTQRDGVVYLHCDGHPTGDTADRVLSHGDPVTTHAQRVDLSDPDWFEVEAARVTEARIARIHPFDPPTAEQHAEVEAAVRRGLTRCLQPGNISPLDPVHPDAANGRARVGDLVTFSQPMYGETTCEVLGKRARVDIAGHDGTQVLWEETGEVEYALADTRTGGQSVTTLGGHGWRRR